MRIVYGICGFFLICAGAFVLYASILTLSQARASAKWPAAPGHVVTSEVKSVRGSRSSTYAPNVSYTYVVGTSTYNGSNVTFSSYSSSTSYASDVVSEYPVGAEVQIYYDPQQPQRSVLRPGTNWFSYFLPAVSLVFVVFGVALLRLASRGRGPIKAA